MSQFKSEASKIKLGTGRVIVFNGGVYTSTDEDEVAALASHPLVEQVDGDSSEAPQTSQTEPAVDYQTVKAEADELGIPTVGKKKEDIADEVAAYKAADEDPNAPEAVEAE